MGRLFSKCLNFSFLFFIFTITVMDNQLFGQQITLDREVHMLALGDSYTIGESVDMNQRWPHQFIAELRKVGKDVHHPDYIATTGWTTRDLIQGIAVNLDREKDYNLVSILIGQDSSRIFMLSIPDYAYTPFGKGVNCGILLL
jgi:hypothetical protein